MTHNIQPIHKPDYEDPKEPHAFYGLAAYYAQCFEQSIILLLIALKAAGAKGVKGATYDEALAALDRDTLGTLIRHLKTVAKIRPELESRMSELLERRNYLAHHFFMRNIHKLLSETGRRIVLDELWQIAQAFQYGDHALVAIYEPLFLKFGIKQEDIEKEMVKMRSGIT